MYYKVKDASYWYEMFGEGEPLVFLHGFTGASSTWEGFVDCFSDDFTMIIIDLPGHGKTTAETPKTMESFCSDLADLLSHLNLDTVHLVGYSMGGRTALSFAVFNPKMVKSLILESASPGLEDSKERFARKENDEQLALRIEQEGLNSFVDFWENISLFETQKALPEFVQSKVRKERLSQTEAGLAESLRYMGTGSQPSWWSRLPELKMPICLVVGRLDEKFVRLNEAMEKELREGKLIIAEDAGHALHVERPGFFGKIVNEFVKEVSV
ncbi:2-succinyl-6-hydroxy-2,4-cyclohexadiene-1-carboxylate synthase [Virgibacillus kekensis]|uniref:Putative 2-succinyl-6-hydroxy-2,4-cyclohexadiene-1-carboxylate synthase n=1 Tax=Virgibacillus kekensis TaxID=202261 RepID=A0ABV9DIE9_9BACI